MVFGVLSFFRSKNIRFTTELELCVLFFRVKNSLRFLTSDCPFFKWFDVVPKTETKFSTIVGISRFWHVFFFRRIVDSCVVCCILLFGKNCQIFTRNFCNLDSFYCCSILVEDLLSHLCDFRFLELLNDSIFLTLLSAFFQDWLFFVIGFLHVSITNLFIWNWFSGGLDCLSFQKQTMKKRDGLTCPD